MGLPHDVSTVKENDTLVTFPSKRFPLQVVMVFLRMGMFSISVDVSRSEP